METMLISASPALVSFLHWTTKGMLYTPLQPYSTQGGFAFLIEYIFSSFENSTLLHIFYESAKMMVTVALLLNTFAHAILKKWRQSLRRPAIRGKWAKKLAVKPQATCRCLKIFFRVRSILGLADAVYTSL